LDGKQASGSYAAASHTHAQADVTNLVSDLAGKAPTSHTHAQADVTNLVSDLAGKADSGHSHSGLAPTGGSTGQVLKKNSATNFDYAWAADEEGAGGGSGLDYKAVRRRVWLDAA
jgi:hypothetical protein